MSVQPPCPASAASQSADATVPIMRGIALLLLTTLLSACASRPSTPPPRETVAEAVSIGLGGSVWTGSDRDQAWREARLAALLSEPLDTAAALEVAALADQEILALLAELDAQRAATEQAGLLPNPSFRLMAMRMEAGRVSGVTMLDYGLMQDLIAVFTRGRRLAQAEADERARAFATAAAIMDRLWRAEAAYAQAVSAGERAGIWAQRGDLAMERAELARALASRGALSQTQATDRVAQSSRLLQMALEANDNATARKAALAEVLGLESANGIQLPDSAPEPASEPDSPEALRAAALDLRLDLLAAQANALRDAEAQALIERWRLLPSLGVGVAGEREADGVGALGAEIALTVPLFDQGQARLAGAEANLAASQARIAARERQIAAGVDRAFADWQREHNRLQQLSDQVQPELASLLAQHERNYRDGISDRFTVLDAADALLALAIDQLDANEARWLARIELSRQTGTALPLERSE